MAGKTKRLQDEPKTGLPIEPDLEAVDQFGAIYGATRDDPATAQRNLMRAVLSQAVGESRNMASVTLRDRQAARRWILSDEGEWPFSFLNICSTLRLDPAYIREGLRASWVVPAPRVEKVVRLRPSLNSVNRNRIETPRARGRSRA